MKSRLITLFLPAALLLAGCDEAPNKPPVPHTDDTKQGAVLFKEQRNALDKAKAVEPKLEEAAQQQREAIEKAGKSE